MTPEERAARLFDPEKPSWAGEIMGEGLRSEAIGDIAAAIREAVAEERERIMALADRLHAMTCEVTTGDDLIAAGGLMRRVFSFVIRDTAVTPPAAGPAAAPSS